jgi:hypothetical protein
MFEYHSVACRIGEDTAKQNVFTVEREAKNALFKLRSRSSSVTGGPVEEVAGAVDVQPPASPAFAVLYNHH